MLYNMKVTRNDRLVQFQSNVCAGDRKKGRMEDILIPLGDCEKINLCEF